MKILDEIIEELRGWAENCMWTTGHEAELFGMADDLEVIKEQLALKQEQLREVYLAKALKDGGRPVTAPTWHDAEREKPQPFVPVLLFLPEEAPLPTVHEGYILKDGGYRTHLYGACRPTKWMEMPEVEE